MKQKKKRKKNRISFKKKQQFQIRAFSFCLIDFLKRKNIKKKFSQLNLSRFFFGVFNRLDSTDNRIRHYVLKRSDSYDGLGILLSADVDTRLQHSIRDVEPNSPADRIGLRKNDRIIGVNGINVENIDFAHVLLLIKQGLNENHLQFSVLNDPTID